MGKTNSKNADTVKLQADIAQLQSQLNETQVKAQEAQNLLRYKVEVLVNMLATEEKRAEVTENRLSTLKMLVSSKGIDEKFLLSGNSNPTLQVDIDGAIQRMVEQFSLYRVDIIQAFADSEGKIITTISYDDFMKQIYTVTDENITTTDIQVISIRFGNGYGSVSVPDFLEYFTTPPQVRVAKASTSAVRMSLDLLQLEMDMDQTVDVKNSVQDPSKDASNRGVETHRMDNLDSGARKLVLMWKIVRQSIQNEISNVTITSNFDNDGQIIPVTDFKIIMHTCCGDSSLPLRESNSAPSSQPPLPLNDSDIDLLVARFELRDTIHAGLFLQYFDELSRIQEYFSIKRGLGVSASIDKLSVSPFQVASEWKQLRAQSVLAQNKAVTEKIIRKSLLSPLAEVLEPVPSSVLSPALEKDTNGAEESSSLNKGVAPKDGDPAKIKDEEKIEQPNSTKELPEQKESSNAKPVQNIEQKNEADSSGAGKQGNDIPLNKPSFMDFFRCGRAKKDDDPLQNNAPSDLPKAQPEEKVDSTVSKADVKNADESFVAEEKRGEGKMETPDEKRYYSPEEQALAIEVGGDPQSPQPLQIKQDAKFSTPPKAMLVGGGGKSNREKFDADTKKPSFSKPKGPVSAAATPASDNDGYSSQASDLSRRQQQQQQQATTTEKKRNNSRFRKIPQKDFDVEDFADDSGSNGNDSFYRNKQQDLTPQDNLMSRRRPSAGSEGEEKDHRAVNFARGQ